jgi:FkbM family methyltransferase
MGIRHKTMILHSASTGVSRATAIRVPLQNRLEYIQRWTPLYDFWLPRMMALASQRFPAEVMIDVGANVGDTVLAARLAGCTAPIVAIEASPAFAAILRRNLTDNAALAGETQVIEAIVVGKSKDVEFQMHRTATGLTRPVSPGDGAESSTKAAPGGSPPVRLDELKIRHCSVLKIDTDGFDAFILDGAMDWLGKIRPIIFAETEVTSEAGVSLWRSVLERLEQRGFARFMLFDNEGGLCSKGTLDASSVQMLADLIAYSHQEAVRFTRGERLKMPEHYFDLALFPTERVSFYDEYLGRVEQQYSSLRTAGK